MSSTAFQIGQTGLSQYSILKFVKEHKPSTEQIIKFVNENFSLLVPRVGYSKYNYITQTLVEKRLIKLEHNNYKILDEGTNELNFLINNVENIDNIVNELGMKFDI